MITNQGRNSLGEAIRQRPLKRDITDHVPVYNFNQLEDKRPLYPSMPVHKNDFHNNSSCPGDQVVDAVSIDTKGLHNFKVLDTAMSQGIRMLCDAPVAEPVIEAKPKNTLSSSSKLIFQTLNTLTSAESSRPSHRRIAPITSSLPSHFQPLVHAHLTAFGPKRK